MTARISLVAAVIAVFVFACDTERNIGPVYETYFTKYYGIDGNQFGVDLAVGSDGSMVMLGQSLSQTNPVPRAFIVKTDGRGTVLWQRQMGGDHEVPVDVEFDSNNNILVVSNVSTAGGVPSPSIRVTRISQSGAGIDSILITHETGVSLYGTAVTELSDRNLIVTGYGGPDLVLDTELPPPDEEDLLIYRLDPGFDLEPKLMDEQGGEHVGKIVKLFEARDGGSNLYYRFGDSDRPLNQNGGVFRQSFEAAGLNDVFKAITTVVAPAGDVQVAREAIEMPVAADIGYLMVGSTGGASKQIFIAQYLATSSEFSIRFSKVIPTPRPAEGVSVAYGDQETMFVLANEQQDNNNYDIYLVKLQSDGKVVGSLRFGSAEGNDEAGAVRVLPDGRVAVFGTIELETQKKMMLTLISPMGTFSQ